jgi:hypothetical protein
MINSSNFLKLCSPLLISLLVVALTACGDSGPSDAANPAPTGEKSVEPLSPGNTGPAPSCETGDDFRISWGDAEQNLNTKVAMIGPVSALRTEDDGSVVLEIGDVEELPTAKPVTVLLTSNVLGRLPANPEMLYANEAVCVIGVPQRLGDGIRLTINEPSEIRVI